MTVKYSPTRRKPDITIYIDTDSLGTWQGESPQGRKFITLHGLTHKLSDSESCGYELIALDEGLAVSYCYV
jgi:hypothetical protein